MLLHEAYIHVQQGLQNIAAFVYRNVELPELDYFWNKGTDKFIHLAIPNLDDDVRDERFSSIQASLDDLRVLTVRNASLVSLSNEITTGGYTYKQGILPTEYRHLLNDRTIVSPVVPCNPAKTAEVPNRLTKQDNLFNILENSLHKTSINSPVSKIDGNILTVYNTYKGQKQFNIENVLIDYIKAPVKVAYSTPTNPTLEFPDNVCFKIIDTTLLYIMKVSEQNPNKIQFLSKS
jgi:hypothetical protein